MADYKVIDMGTYARKEHFDYFRSLAYPYTGVTVTVDVTDLLRCTKQRKISFYLTFMHAAALAADEIPEFRRRIRDDGIIEYEECPTSHTEMKDNDTYCYCTLHHHMPFEEYIVYAEEERRKAVMSGTIEEDDDVDSMYFVSVLPWLHYSDLVQPVGGTESNPRITWGKYQTEADGRIRMPVTVLVHHGLADGLHMGRFYEALERQMNAISSKHSV